LQQKKDEKKIPLSPTLPPNLKEKKQDTLSAG